MCPTKTNVRAVLQFRLKPNIDQFITPATSFLPQFLSLQSTHHQFLAINLVHFLANNLLNILKNSQTQRQKRIHARHRFMYVASTNQKLSISRNLASWCLLQSSSKKLCHSHIFLLYININGNNDSV